LRRSGKESELVVGRLIGEEAGYGAIVVRRGYNSVESRLETLDGSVRTVLFRGGDFEVYLGEKFNPAERVLSGNVNERTTRYERGGA
jgi:hypothetical protein